MNLTKSKIVSSIVIFLICFIIHFGYDVFPNSVTAIFFPVNESIWEHLKMLYTAIILNGLIDYFIMKKCNIKFNNFFISLSLTSVLSIPIFLILYLPFYYKMGAKMLLNFIILFITIVITQIIAYYIQKMDAIKIPNVIPIVVIIICYIMFGILTYFPIKNELFFDAMNEKYGINTYRLSA